VTENHRTGGHAPLSRDELGRLVAAGDVDTVIVAFTDMQGRLMGKRVSARFFLDEVAEHGAECCNYLFAVDVDMSTVDGYDMAGWDSGYGDMAMLPDRPRFGAFPGCPARRWCWPTWRGTTAARSSPLRVAFYATSLTGSTSMACALLSPPNWNSWCSTTRIGKRGPTAIAG